MYMYIFHFHYFFTEDKTVPRFSGGVPCGCETQGIPFYPRGVFQTQGMLPGLPSPHYSLSSSSGIDSLPGKSPFFVSNKHFIELNPLFSCQTSFFIEGEKIIVYELE